MPLPLLFIGIAADAAIAADALSMKSRRPILLPPFPAGAKPMSIASISFHPADPTVPVGLLFTGFFSGGL